MAKIGLFYGTQTGNTQTIAEVIQKELGGDSVVDLYDIATADTSDFESYQYLIVGCPTWNVGELQSDWEGFYDELDKISFQDNQSDLTDRRIQSWVGELKREFGI